MSNPPAFQMYADNFLSGTGDMTAEEVGCYIRLLLHSWSRDGLPDDTRKIALMCGKTKKNSITIALAKFSKADDGLLRNSRLEKERAKQIDHREKQAGNANKRWEKRDAVALPSHTSGICQTDALKSSSSSSKEDSAPQSGDGVVIPKIEKPKKEPRPVNSEHARFIDLWTSGYEHAHGEPYVFQGGKDGAAVSALLKSVLPLDRLILIAVNAWKHPELFNCKAAASISGFHSRLNDIRAELNQLKKTTPPPSKAMSDSMRLNQVSKFAKRI